MSCIAGARHLCLALFDNTPTKDYQNCAKPLDRSWFTLGGKNMKRILFVGLIALLVLIAVPSAMAIGGDAGKKVDVSGTLDATLSIDNNLETLVFSPFVFGVNDELDQGTLTVKAYWTAWTVTASSSTGDNYMYDSVTPLHMAFYTKTDKTEWKTISGFALSGPKTTSESTDSFVTSFSQELTADDVPGTYGMLVTYTVTAA
jgi:hypothetical protein